MTLKSRFRLIHFGSALVLTLGLLGSASPARAATPPAPSGAHPRLLLSADVLATLKANMGKSGSAMSAVIAHCQEVIDKPTNYTGRGYQGDAWSYGASACALAWQVTQNPAFAAAGIKLWRTLLADDQMMGDGLACSSTSVTPTQAIQSIGHDTNYAIRFIGPHAAMAYDWLHDAPGADAALLALSRFCFRQWIDFYTKSGYHHDEPASNYHAGYAVSKALIAVAEGGEDGANSDRIWTETVETLFEQQLVGEALAGSDDPAAATIGAMVGGDWPEGWQYGPLSVTEYAVAARALEEQGVTLPLMDSWTNSLMVHYFYGLTPGKDGFYAGGDLDSDSANASPPTSALSAVLLGPSSDDVAGWAAKEIADRGGRPDNGALDAIAEARAVAPRDFYSPPPSLWYLARGTRNLFARSGWDAGAFWSVFTSSPRLASDHQHVDATNFVFSRGADDLIVDPSPYGSRSTLTSNALSVDSVVVLGDYKPSQTGWGTPSLAWVRGTQSGVVAARGDIAKAFNFTDTPSDVPFARREWVFLPEGEIVTIDRVRTDVASRQTYLRFRTPAKLALAIEGGAWVAKGDVGGSSVVVHAVNLSGGTPSLITPPVVGGCDDVPHFGDCRNARIAVTEYNLLIPGPQALAIHVVDGLAQGEAPAQVGSINDPPYETTPPENGGVIGVGLFRSAKQTFVVASSGPDGASGATMTYGVLAQNPSRHIVYDAPADASGNATVTATASGDRCQLTIVPGGTMAARPLMFTVATAADGCTVADDVAVAPGTVPPGGGVPAHPAHPQATNGCGCLLSAGETGTDPLSLLVGAGIFAGLLALRRRR